MLKREISNYIPSGLGRRGGRKLFVYRMLFNIYVHIFLYLFIIHDYIFSSYISNPNPNPNRKAFSLPSLKYTLYAIPALFFQFIYPSMQAFLRYTSTQHSLSLSLSLSPFISALTSHHNLTQLNSIQLKSNSTHPPQHTFSYITLYCPKHYTVQGATLAT